MQETKLDLVVQIVPNPPVTAEDLEEDENIDPTVLEELDYDAIKVLIARHDSWPDRRLQRHVNELAAIEAKRVIVELHNKELEDLQV